MKHKQNGFGIVEIIIVVVVVAVVGIIGWMVLQPKNDSSQTETKTQSQQAPPAEQKTVGYLELKEFGAKIPLTSETSGLKLGPVDENYSNGDKNISIIVPELDAGWKCVPNPIGDFKGTIGNISITTKDKRGGPGEPVVSKKVGKYTFGFEGPDGLGCTDNPKHQQLFDAFKVQFGKIEAN